MLVRIDDLVRSHGAVPRADLRSIKRHLTAIAPGLVARGYEIGSSIRLPLEKQLLEQVRDGFVLRKGLERRVAGASAREVKDAVQRLIEKGSLVEVVRESGVGLVGATEDTIEASELEELLRCLVKIEKLARNGSNSRAHGKSWTSEPQPSSACRTPDGCGSSATSSPGGSAWHDC